MYSWGTATSGPVGGRRRRTLGVSEQGRQWLMAEWKTRVLRSRVGQRPAAWENNKKGKNGRQGQREVTSRQGC